MTAQNKPDLPEFYNEIITGIFIRANLPEHGYVSIDIADNRLPKDQLWEWVSRQNIDNLKHLTYRLLTGESH